MNARAVPSPFDTPTQPCHRSRHALLLQYWLWPIPLLPSMLTHTWAMHVHPRIPLPRENIQPIHCLPHAHCLPSCLSPLHPKPAPKLSSGSHKECVMHVWTATLDSQQSIIAKISDPLYFIDPYKGTDPFPLLNLSVSHKAEAYCELAPLQGMQVLQCIRLFVLPFPSQGNRTMYILLLKHVKSVMIDFKRSELWNLDHEFHDEQTRKREMCVLREDYMEDWWYRKYKPIEFCIIHMHECVSLHSHICIGICIHMCDIVCMCWCAR